MKKAITILALSLICFATQAQETKEVSKTSAPEKELPTTNQVILTPVAAIPIHQQTTPVKKETVSTGIEKTNANQEVVLTPVQAVPLSQYVPTNTKKEVQLSVITTTETTQNKVVVLPAVQAIPYKEQDKSVPNHPSPK